MQAFYSNIELRHQAGFFIAKPLVERCESNTIVIWARDPALNRVNGNVPALVSQPADNVIQGGVFRIMATSKLQAETKKRLRLLLADRCFIENYRPDWLKNPETGSNLEVDFWLPETDIAIEVQGNQHFEFVPHFHGTEEGFYAQLQRDALKKVLCQKHGVILYEIALLEEIDEFVKSIMRRDNIFYEWLNERNHAIKALARMAAEVTRLPKKPKTRGAALEVVNKRDKLLRRMVVIAEQHNIPFSAIEPDLTVKKHEMFFAGCPRVVILLYTSDGEIVDGKKGALVYVKDGVAHVQWYKKIKGKRTWKRADFDIESGWQVYEQEEASYPRWRLRLDTLPDDIKQIQSVEEGQQIIWHGEDPYGKYDFDLPTEATVLKLRSSGRQALVQIETRSGTLYKKWVSTTEVSKRNLVRMHHARPTNH